MPQAGNARVRITYDPGQTNPNAIKEAVTEACFDEAQNFERVSPFKMEGYEPWGDSLEAISEPVP